MSGGSAVGESERAAGGGGAGSSEGERFIRLMEEFRRRQRERPELVVRPWWSPGAGGAGEGGAESDRAASGFVVEYCPGGVESAELAVRRDRVRVEGPDGLREATLGLEAGWILDGEDRRSPETVVNHLLWMADRVLGES